MRLAIVGCGLIGGKRAAAARRAGHPVIAVADADPARAAALAATTGAVVAADWRAAVAADVDAVIVATTHAALADIGLGAIAAGRHVLIEKPAGRSAAEVAPLADAARTSGVVAKVGFNHRFHPALLKAKALVDEGVTGPLLYIRGRYGHGGRLGMEKEWRCQAEVSGGGELIDQGSHLIDLSRWFLGDLTLEYGKVATLYWNTPVDDNCFLSLRAEDGALAWLHATWVEWKNLFSFEIVGRDAKLEVNGLGGSYGVERLTLYKLLPELGPPETTSWEYPFPDTSWDREFADFEDACRTGRRPIGDIEDALAMHRLIDQVYQRTPT